MIKVQQFENQFASSICYLVYTEKTKRCIIIDPGSEKSLKEIDFIKRNNLNPEYIFLTHEHMDHTWGVNSLLESFSQIKVVCSEKCKEALPKEGHRFFQYYYNDVEKTYSVARADYTTEELANKLIWDDIEIHFYNTPGHCKGSICIEIDSLLFGGDTLMPYKPFVKRQLGGSLEEYKTSLLLLIKTIKPTTLVYPGHGGIREFQELLPFYSKIMYN